MMDNGTTMMRGPSRRLSKPACNRGILAGLALKAGVNASLLRKWVRKHQTKCESGSAMPQTAEERPALAPVITLACAEAVACEPHETSKPRHAVQSSRLGAELPNGVVLTLEYVSREGTLMTAMVETLGAAILRFDADVKVYSASRRHRFPQEHRRLVDGRGAGAGA
jgi:transposase